MKKIDVDWLKRIIDVHDRLERGVPLSSKTSRCTKGILIDRYFKFLDNRAFKLRIPVTPGKYTTEDKMEYEIFYGWFHKITHTITSCNDHDGEVYNSYGVQKHMGYNNHEFTISFRNEKLIPKEFKLHWNDILRITYEEITLEEYWKISMLFVDTEPPIPKTPNYNYCEHFDEAQGRYHCVTPDVSGNKCKGVYCGFYKETR